MHLVAVSICLVFLPGQIPPASSPRAVLERGIQAMGGEAALGSISAYRQRSTATLRDNLEKAKVKTEVFVQFPDKVREVHRIEVEQNRSLLILVLDGNKGFEQQDGQTTPLDAASVRDMKNSLYVDGLSHLVPLLRDPAYQLSALDEAKVRERPSLGILVKRSQHPDVKMYFDKATGYLSKIEYRGPSARTNQEVTNEQYFWDYQEASPSGQDEAILKKAGQGTTAEDLLALLRTQTLSDIEIRQIDRSVHDLGSASFETRNKAKEELLKAGPRAAAALSRAVRDPDPEVVAVARECLKKLGQSNRSRTTQAALRLLARRKPAGATAVVLAYLPSAPDEATLAAARGALKALAASGGKPDPLLVKAKEDRNALRRAAAEEILRGQGKALSVPLGLKVARHGTDYIDGKKVLEWQLDDVEFYTRLDDKLFQKP